MTDSLGTLLSQSWKFLVSHFQAVFIASALLAIVLTGAQLTMSTAMKSTTMGTMPSVEKMEDLAKMLEEGDEDAVMEMMDSMGMMDENGELNDNAMEAMAANAVKDMLPNIALFMLIGMALSLVANIFYMVLAVDGSLSASAAFGRVPGLILPMIGIWIWSFLRSFAWIPILGIIPAIIIGPRLMMSSVILIKERTGVLESVRLSYQRSSGYWGKIVGNSIVAGLVIMLGMILVGIVVGMLQVVSADVSRFIGSLAQYIAMGYGAAFYVRLSETIMANPLVATTK